MTSPKSDFLPQALRLNTIIFEVMASTYEFVCMCVGGKWWEHSVHGTWGTDNGPSGACSRTPSLAAPGENV